MAKRKNGQRTKSGRLSRAKGGPADPRKAWDYGNPRVVARRELFDCMAIKGGKAVDQVFDGIGQLWALDFLDGHGLDGDTLRDAGRKYAELYWGYYPGGPSISNYDQRTRSSDSGEIPPASKRDLYFAKLDLYLPRPSHERDALFDLVIDPHNGDSIAHWAEAIVKYELLKRGRVSSHMRFPDGNDYALLGAAVRALCALVDGQMPNRWSEAA